MQFWLFMKIKFFDYLTNIAKTYNNSLIMKQRKKIKYVEKQPPDKQNTQINPSNPPTILAKENTRDAKVEGKNNNQAYLISHQQNDYRQNKREQYKPKYVSKKEGSSQREEQHQQSSYNRNYQNNKRRQEEVPSKFTERQSSHHDQSCIICSEEIRRKDFIWTCSCCCISMHLKCIKQWIQNINQQQDKASTIIFNWKCPQCNFQYNEPIPKYYCYCGKHLNPEFDRDLSPHSCGEICSKKRGLYCPHPCPDICHRGKCRPCDYEGISVTCQCGKSQRLIKCSEERQAFQCGKKCEKILNCHKHKCERNCHSGGCMPCKKKHMATCYCGKGQDIIDCGMPSYSCGQICSRLLDCGFHKCEQKCHNGDCNKCNKTPAIQNTCPCGKYQIQMLTGDPEYRKSCQDPIPVCGMPCSKKLQCGHVCPRSCHEGPCSQCKVIVEQNCDCSLQSRKIQCWKKSKEHFKCQTVCKKKRSCGQHLCNQICCKFRNSPILQNHPCEMNCNKMLNCEKHECGQACHIGLCKKCPVIYSQPQPCPCGKTSLKPPIICGTLAPECNNVCEKQLACGHVCKNLCHYGPCKCYQHVIISCRCGKEKIETTCGREALCLNKCQQVLQCGHKCNLQCHKDTCKIAHKSAPCRKMCNRQRVDCHHFCPQLCHPDQQCESFSCEAEILVKCDCGHRQTMTLCGAHDHHKTHKAIVCNKKCENLRRFDILYKGKETYYPGNMVQFAFKNYNYLQNLENRLQKFILHSDQNFIEIQYKFPDNLAKLLLTNLFENHYHLNTHFYRYRKYAAFTLMQSENTMIPKPVLTEYIKLISNGSIKQSNLPFQFTISFQIDQKQKVDHIQKSMKQFLHTYYSERNNKFVSLHFWNTTDGQQALKFLEHEYQTIEFKCGYNTNKVEEEVTQNQIVESEITEQEIAKEAVQQKNKVELLHKQETPLERPLQVQQVVTSSQQPQQIQQKQSITSVAAQKKIPPSSKPQQNPSKLIVRKGIPTFKKNEYPQAKDNIQDIYLIDEDELYGQVIDWNNYVKTLCNKKMGPQATEWRIRTLLMVSSIIPVEEHIFYEQFNSIISMYNKDKQSAMRILQIQRIESKSVKKQMVANGIYLSDHQPQILGYLQFYNYMAEEKIPNELPSILYQTHEMQKTHEVIEAMQKKDVQTFYNLLMSADYLFSCAMIPLVHQLREIILLELSKGARVSAKNLFKHLIFGSQECFLSFASLNGLILESRTSKTTKQELYYVKSGEILKQIVKDNVFVTEIIYCKRDKKYFLVQSEEHVNEKYMTRSFFAFGDFKESISPKYMTALVRLLKQQQ